MTLQEQHHMQNELLAGSQADRRRWFLLAMIGAVLLLMAFYALTDGAYIEHDPLLEAGDWGGYALCHRITERSFTVYGRQFPLCARCTGMYLGAALVSLVLLLAGRLRRVLLPPQKLFIVLLAFIALMGIDGINSYSHFFPNAPHLYEPHNWLRLATGMGTGLTLGIIVWAALAQALWNRPRYAAVIANGRELAGLLLLSLLAMALVLSNQPQILYVMALVSAGSLLFVVTALNTALLLIIVRRDGRAQSWSQALLPLLVGLLLAIVELSVISYLRLSLTGTMTGLPGL